MSPQQQPKLLLIRPMITNDDFTNNFSYPASDLATTASNEGWHVTELAINNANRNRVGIEIGAANADFIIHYGHGMRDKIFGQGYPNVAILECNNATENVNSLSSSVVSTVSCSSAAGLGDAFTVANKNGGFLGHNAPYGCEYAYWEYFKRASNAANIALLEGKKFSDAKEAGYQAYTDEINDVLNLPILANPAKYVAAVLLWIDRETLTIKGKGSATAK